MSAARKSRSLFWTLATIFLVATVFGTVAQWLIAAAVLRPLEAREARSRSQLEAARLAVELAAPDAPRTEADVESLLAHHRIDLGLRPSWVAYRSAAGVILSAPPGRGRQIEDLLATGSGGPAAGDRAPAGVRHEILARHRVTRGDAPIGEVLIVRPIRAGAPAGLFQPLLPVLFIPIAMLASACAGLILLRLLVRRLAKLEALATRVSEGDLSARVADESGDEIGRVAERLDAMADRLAEARDRLEANERQRRQLFADITHELATPLTSIRGYAETLLDPAVQVTAAEGERYLRGIQEEARRLDRLTRDLFDLARLEAGASRLAPEPIDWAALCRNTIERFEPRFQAAGLALAWRGPSAEAWVEADGRRLEQVLENLLTNALRYVPVGGTIVLRLDRVEGGDQAATRYRLAVEDDGPGLAPAEMAQLFERFYRAAGARPVRSNGDAEGSGLGLAIVREIIEQHGGTVEAHRLEPRGLAIRVTLPARSGGGT